MDIMQFEAPDSVEAAVALLADAGDGGRILAGGTDLLVQLRMGMIKPSLIIDVKNIQETTVIKDENGGEWQDWIVDDKVDQELKFAHQQELTQRKKLMDKSKKFKLYMYEIDIMGNGMPFMILIYKVI